ncbi:phage integrase SAM-like domain-containing protein [Mucilaginibacter angelicae]|uniref:Phage integrase SAM-like domain-containing protein n=1 Tax=Mucilaginibacter angelicae TaxID=869718 RepID=A0ABV6L5E8_9SPHI
MATVALTILKNHKKKDGTYNVKIRISHKGRSVFLRTYYFLSGNQLSSDRHITDASVYKHFEPRLRKYRAAIGQLSSTLDFYTVEDLKNALIDLDQDVDFIKFGKEYIENLLENGRKGSARTLKTVIFSLIDYFEREKVSALEITERKLMEYEKYLRKERVITRLNKEKLITRTVAGMQDGGIHNHMRDLRILFKAAMKHFNNPQLEDIKIPHCPFDNYKIIDSPVTKKRNLKIEQIKLISESKVEPNSTSELGRDLFLLSFYLCGMNAADIYHLKPENIVDGRVEYNRLKTQSRRKDRAFISIKIIDEALPILKKYIGKLSKRYTNSENLDRAINRGLKEISRNIEKLPEITFYWARHSFGNIARNKCRKSKDDVALALNHVDNYHKTVDIYLDKDWTIVDEVQEAVVSLL